MKRVFQYAAYRYVQLLMLVLTAVTLLTIEARLTIGTPMGNPLALLRHIEPAILLLLALGWALVWKVGRELRKGRS